MKALIIGAAGFVGGYLMDHLQRDLHWDVAATKLAQEKIARAGVDVYDLDILDCEAIVRLLDAVQPDYIFHLAAQSSVALSWKNPNLTIDINVKGTANVLEALRAAKRPARLLLIGSGEEYGHVLPEEVPIGEDNTLRPGNIYAATKATQNMLGSIYARAYQLDVLMVRAFNHIGPEQRPMFVVADFCKQVADIEKGKSDPVMRVGNLAARRDFTDVRDVVRAYALLVQRGEAGQVYNVGSGRAVSIQQLLDQILAYARVKIDVQVDSARLRPVDVPIIEADIRKLHTATGWQPEIPLAQTIRQTLDYWRGAEE